MPKEIPVMDVFFYRKQFTKHSASHFEMFAAVEPWKNVQPFSQTNDIFIMLM
jgi:hypothetical protein